MIIIILSPDAIPCHSLWLELLGQRWLTWRTCHRPYRACGCSSATCWCRHTLSWERCRLAQARLFAGKPACSRLTSTSGAAPPSAHLWPCLVGDGHPSLKTLYLCTEVQPILGALILGGGSGLGWRRGGGAHVCVRVILAWVLYSSSLAEKPGRVSGSLWWGEKASWTHALLSTPVKDPQAVGTQRKGHVLVGCLVTAGFLMLMNGILVAGEWVHDLPCQDQPLHTSHLLPGLCWKLC